MVFPQEKSPALSENTKQSRRKAGHYNKVEDQENRCFLFEGQALRRGAAPQFRQPVLIGIALVIAGVARLAGSS